ncbi:putative transcriptional regulator [Dehalobacter sp. CF]|nr:putative transcriptional regulator [Dehalobacter sp. CF]
MNRIKQRLHELNMTQEELALIIGIPQSEVSRIAAEKRPDLTLRTASKISIALGGTVEYIFPDYFKDCLK